MSAPDIPRPVPSSKQPGLFAGAAMHADVRIELAGTISFPASAPSFASTCLASYRDKAIFETWPPYTGVRS